LKGEGHDEIKHVAIDGNLAFIHMRYLNWVEKEHAAVVMDQVVK